MPFDCASLPSWRGTFLLLYTHVLSSPQAPPHTILTTYGLDEFQRRIKKKGRRRPKCSLVHGRYFTISGMTDRGHRITDGDVRKKIRRVVSGPRKPVNGAPPSGDVSMPDDNERTPIIRPSSSPGRPQASDDDPPWRRAMKQTWNATRDTLLSNYVNALLFFVPLGIVAGIAGWNPTTIFTLNFLAIIPLASLLSFATEELSAKLGQTIGGLLNATFGNAIELIVRCRRSPCAGSMAVLGADRSSCAHRSASSRSRTARFV